MAYDVEKVTPGPSKSTSILAVSSPPPAEELDCQSELSLELLAELGTDAKPNR